jgi:hypothetical protein
MTADVSRPTVPALPTRLYRFRDTDKYTKPIFTDRTLFFARPTEFNDPFDCGFHIPCQGERSQQVIASQAIKQVRKLHPEFTIEQAFDAANQVAAMIVRRHRSEASGQFGKILTRDFNDRAGILCLSATATNVLLWSHYANGHTGICLEFRTDVKGSIFTRAQPVTYSRKYPRLDLHTLVVDELFRNATSWMLTKSRDWAYEQEWRVLDFKKGRGPRPFPAKCLTAVILGCRISDKDRKKVMGWVRRFPARVQVKQAKPADHHFRVEIEDVA